MNETKTRNGLQKATDWLLQDGKLLIAGSLIAFAWAQIDYYGGTETLDHFVHYELKGLFVDTETEDHGHAMTVHYMAGILMAFFFAIAAGEVRESTLPGGALSSPKKSAVPLVATAGGVVGPVAVYLGLAFLSGRFLLYGYGWAIPTATDIAFSYLVGTKIFGKGHPAVAFLLLLAIADDAIGLMIIAIGYTDYANLHLIWMLLPVGATIGTILTKRLFHGHRNHSHWWYAPWMAVSLLGFVWTGVEPALGFVPVIWFMPHAHSDRGLFAPEEEDMKDSLNQFQHFWEPWVEVVLFFFALVNVGVPLAGIGWGTVYVLLGLIVGKTIGILGLTWVAVEKLPFGLALPKGMNYHQVTCLGIIAAIGFTVALFVAGAAFSGEQYAIQLPEAKLGALFSFAAAPLAFAYAWLTGIKPGVLEE